MPPTQNPKKASHEVIFFSEKGSLGPARFTLDVGNGSESRCSSCTTLGLNILGALLRSERLPLFLFLSGLSL